MTKRRVLAGPLLAMTFLHAPHALAQDKQDVLAPIQVEGEAGDSTSDFDGCKARKVASAGKSDQPLEKTPQAVSVVDRGCYGAAGTLRSQTALQGSRSTA
ncbi:MAG: hypothetical protein E5W57_17375, partial [Mesorhizobium sp.]